MSTAIVEVTAFNSILPIPAFTPPASTVTESIPSESSATNEQSFGGANNGNVGTETTTTNGETVFASVNLQAGGANSFSNGNQTTTSPISNPNIFWGAAAAAMLGATLAEWQKKREEEAARLVALLASNAGQGDEDEIPPDVLAKRRGKVIAKNQAKRAQERVWEAARTQQQTQQAANIAKAVQADMTEDEKLAAYKQSPEFIARQERYTEYESQKSLEAQRAGERDAVAIANAYKAQEQARQNAVDAARWAGVASVAQGKQGNEEKNNENWLSTIWNTSIAVVGSVLSSGNSGGGGLLVVNRDGPPNPIKEWWDNIFKSPGEKLISPATKDEITNNPFDAVMKTYIAASINIQSEGKNNDEDDNSHLGLAQLSRNELNTPYGEGFECKNGDCRGYGLGLPGSDPYDPNIAIQGMNNRIMQVIEEADNLAQKRGITLDETDKYIIVAMAQNGPGFDKNDIQRVINNKKYTESGSINWEAFYQDEYQGWTNQKGAIERFFLELWSGGSKDFDTEFMLEKFYEQTTALKENGYYLPENLDTTKIEELIDTSDIAKVENK
ncbi:MAG: hypothetical protein U0V18_09985 [Anaerolineales bacterium]